MTFSLNRFGKNAQYEMSRFASKCYTNVRGAAGKLFKFFMKTHAPKGVVSYAERGLFNGSVYEKLGFVFSHFSQPNHIYFHYLKPMKLYSRIKFQKHKLEKQLIIFDKNLSAWENMKKNGFDRIWNCGNSVYILKNTIDG